MAKDNEDVVRTVRTLKYIFWGFIGIVLLILFFGFYIVSAGERAVVSTFGNPDMTPRAEGLHFKIPIVQSVAIFDVKTMKYEVQKATAASKDLQTVSTDIVVNYYVAPDTVPSLYKNVGVDYQDKVISPAVSEVLKAATAQFSAEDLIVRRAEVKDMIDTKLTERLKSWDINVQSVAITNFDFSEQFNTAVEAKVVAQQNALAAQNKLQQVEFEAQQRIAAANGEAQAIQVQIEAIAKSGGQSYLTLKSIEKWSGNLPVIMSGNAVPFIDMRTLSPTTSTTSVVGNSS